MKQLFPFLLMIYLCSCGGWKHSASFSYEAISVLDFQKRLKETSDYILIDVRTKGEYSKGHIENAQNISYLASDFRKRIEQLPKNKLVFMYCETQHRSPLASMLMKREGFIHIVDLQGGFIKWERLNMPMVN